MSCFPFFWSYKAPGSPYGNPLCHPPSHSLTLLQKFADIQAVFGVCVNFVALTLGCHMAIASSADLGCSPLPPEQRRFSEDTKWTGLYSLSLMPLSSLTAFPDSLFLFYVLSLLELHKFFYGLVWKTVEMCSLPKLSYPLIASHPLTIWTLSEISSWRALFPLKTLQTVKRQPSSGLVQATWPRCRNYALFVEETPTTRVSACIVGLHPSGSGVNPRLNPRIAT